MRGLSEGYLHCIFILTREDVLNKVLYTSLGQESCTGLTLRSPAVSISINESIT